MADMRAKAVLSKIADLQSRSSYIMDKMTQWAGPLGRGDSVQVGSLADFTVSSAVDGSLVPQALSAQSPTLSALTLTADKEPAIAARIGRMDNVQAMNGGYFDGVAETAMYNLKNDMDSDLCEYIVYTMAADTGSSSTYHSNVAGDSLVADDLHNAIATQLSLAGSDFNSLALFLHPFAYGSLLSASDFSYPVSQNDNMLGPKQIGHFFGVPVFVSQSVPKARTITSTSVTISSNVATVVAANHGLSAGVKISIANITTPLTTATAVTSVTNSSTFTVPLTASDGAMADGAGIITVESCENLLIDTRHAFVAQQVMPSVRIVPEPLYTSDILQVSSLWGYVGRANRACVIHSPKASI